MAKAKIFRPEGEPEPFDRDPNDPYALPFEAMAAESATSVPAQIRSERHAEILSAMRDDPERARRLMGVSDQTIDADESA